MNSNPYSNLLNQNQSENQPTVATYPQQEQQYQQYQQVDDGKAYMLNPQQQYIQQQQESQYNPQSLHTVPLLTPTEGIPNKNQFMLTIVIIYILQYSYQIGFIVICWMNYKTDNVFLQNNQITGLFWFLLIMTILTPMIVFNVKGLQNNPQSAIFIILYLIVYAAFQSSLLSVSNKKTYDQDGNSKQFGNFFWLALFELAQICFDISGLLQLTALAIILKIKGDNFTFREFQIVGAIISISASIPFYQQGILFMIMTSGFGMLFTFWFSFGLRRVTQTNFGLKQKQVIFGSFTVFVVMVCPCVTKA